MSAVEKRPYCEDGRTLTGTDGAEWKACDPYPTWFRWDGRTLRFPARAVESDLNRRLGKEVGR